MLYIDPGSGTLILQLVLSAVVGSLFFIRRITFWVRNHVGRLFGVAPSPDDIEGQ